MTAAAGVGVLGDLLRGKTPAQRRWAGALWQRGLRPAPSSGDPVVVLAVPLVSRRRSGDWAEVSANLARTLGSFRAQTSPSWRAYVCGQDRPDGVDFDDRVRFVPFSGGDKFYDKGDKRLALLDVALADLAGRDGYFAQFDADDLLHPGVVAHIVQDDNGRGYLIDSGYMADLALPRVTPLGPAAPGWAPPPSAADDGPDRLRAFWELCGSCVFARFDTRTQPGHWRRLLRRLKSHKRMAAVMDGHGLPLAPIPFAAGIYLVNHGENMSRRRQRETWRLGYLQKHALPEAEARAVLDRFGQ